jgi:hypothetical protein
LIKPQLKVAKISETQRKGHAQTAEEDYIPQPKESSSSETELDGDEPHQDDQQVPSSKSSDSRPRVLEKAIGGLR